MKVKNYLLSTAVGLIAIAASAQTVTNTFNFTGGIQTFTAPCGVDSITITCWGAQGGNGQNGASTSTLTQIGGVGANGGYVQATYACSTGQVFNVFVGGQGATPTGGFNGGGNGGTQNAGGGGGASDVRTGGTAESDRIITAGGGGGGGRGGCESSLGAGGDGGTGGGGNGENGENSPTSGGDAGGGFGAIGSAGGGAGVGCGGFLGQNGAAATGGTGGIGGAGQACCCFTAGSIPGGGGGGGGQIGGGGGGGGSAGTTGCSGNDKGAGGGGAGGSNFSGVGSSVTTNTGIWLGNGMVTIVYEDPTPSVTSITGTSMSMCAGDTLTFMTPSDPEATFYTWTVDAGLSFLSGQNTTSIMVSGMAAGTYSIVAVAVNGTCSLTGPADTIMVTVNANPTVTASVQAMACLADGAVPLSGSPAGGTFSGTAVTGSNFDPSTAGLGSYAITYMYTDSLGCSNWAVDSITVDACLGMSTIIPAGSVGVTPNPAVDMINVSWNADQKVNTITIMDVTGRVVMTEKASNGNTKQLNVSALPAGTYTVSIEGESGKATQTFVKK